MAGQAIVWGLLGCGGPDLAELETRQQQLDKEVAVLRQTVAELRGQMQAMGMVPSGPAAGTDMTVTGALDLSGQLELKVERVGEGPVFPPLGEPERRDTTDCGYRFPVPWLEPISDGALEATGSGRASPIQLNLDSRPLTPHAGPVQYEKTCKFAFRHQPRYLFLSPEDTVGNVAGTWEMRLASEVPLPRSDEREMYWVYPGTTLSFRLGPWNAEEWGELRVELDARVMAVGTPEAPNSRSPSAATATLPSFEAQSEDQKLGFSRTLPAQEGPWTLEISSPEDGPYVLLETLIVGNEKHALVVTAPGAVGGDK
jgi:hypothetical protein